MRAEYRTAVSVRRSIVSSDKNVAGRYTPVTDFGSGMEVGSSPRRSRSINIVQQRQRILVVEPDDQILGLLERWLGEAGYSVVVESSLGSRASASGADPDLVLIDVPEPLGAEKIIESVRQVHAGAILLLSARFRQGAGSSSSVA